MRIFDRNARPRHEDEATPLDAVAVTLAVWLGLIVAVTGLIRLSEHAATLQQAAPASMEAPSVAMQFTPA